MLAESDYQWLFRKAPAMTTSIAENGVYLDVNDPRGLAVLLMTEDPEFFVTRGREVLTSGPVADLEPAHLRIGPRRSSAPPWDLRW